MDNCIFVGNDLHDKNMLLRIAVNKQAAETRSFSNDAGGVALLIAELRRRALDAGNARVLVAYEASGLGFGLRDTLVAAGFECHVLAPSKMAKEKERRNSDETEPGNAGERPGEG